MSAGERIKSLFRNDPAFKAKVMSHILRYLFPIVAIVVFVGCAIALPGSLRAQFGHGTHGTFTAQRLSCDSDGCRWYGAFVSVDGRVRRHRVILVDAGEHDLRPGAAVPALDTGQRSVVYPPEGSSEWAWIVVTLVLSGVIAARSTFAWRSWLRARRHGRHRGPG